MTDIARKVGVSRDTVYKYLAEDDFSPKMPVRAHRASKMDPYADTVHAWLTEDLGEWRKQRHTAHRVWVRLTEELGADVAESTVRKFVAAERAAIQAERDSAGYLDLEWPAGEAQADFGEADFYVMGTKRRLSYFVLEFPHSNVGIAQVFPGETAECVCQALMDIFLLLGGAPVKIVFDNATGVGRRVCGTVRLAELFSAFAAHFGFDYRFCNPRSGNEKGAVENKVGTQRRNLFVPVPKVWDVDGYNGRLAERCLKMAEKEHYKAGEREIDLFEEDRCALRGLPAKPFSCVTYARPKADKKGRVRLDGKHWYSTLPAYAGQTMIAALGATRVEVYDAEGTLVCSHRREYGKAPTDTSDPGSQLALLCNRVGGWENSRVRFALPEDLRCHMDSLGRDELRAECRLLRDQWATSGWEATVQAAQLAFSATGRLDAASVAMAAASAAGDRITYDEPVDLAAYDRAVGTVA